MGRFTKIATSAIVTFVICVGMWLVSENISNSTNGTASSVQQNPTDVQNYLKNLYSSYNSVTITSGNETKVNSENYDQNIMFSYYNNNSSNPLTCEDGICWASATTSLLKFNNASRKDYRDVGVDVIDKALAQKWISRSNTGLEVSVHDSLVTKMFSHYGYSLKGNTDHYNVYANLKTEINNGDACLFMIKGHTMTGCGYVQYTVTYNKKSGTSIVKTTEKQDFVIVNDTWSSTNVHQYSYFPEREIAHTLTTRWSYGITKVR